MNEDPVERFLRWEQAIRDTIDVKRCYIDVAGDLVAGILLSQIIFWFLPVNGKPKLRVEHDGELWLAKSRTDWWAECRISVKQYIRAIGILTKKELVTTKRYKWQGVPTVFLEYLGVHPRYLQSTSRVQLGYIQSRYIGLIIKNDSTKGD